MTTPWQLYEALTPLRHVRRFQLYPTNHPISVAEHHYYVAMLATVFVHQLEQVNVKVSRWHLLEAALWHDAGEAVMGDLQHFAKRLDPELHRVWERVEDGIRDRLMGEVNVTWLSDEARPEQVLVKLADWVELLCYVRTEQQTGNHALDASSARIWTLLRSQLRERVGALRAVYGPGILDWYDMTLKELQQELSQPFDAVETRW